MVSVHMDRTVNDTTTKFVFITEQLLSLTDAKLCDKKLIDACLKDLNELDYRCLSIVNNDAVLLLINQLCGIVLPAEVSLVRNTCKFLTNLTQNNVKLHGRTFATCKRWILEVLEFSQPLAWNDILHALQSFLINGQFNDINHYLHLLLEEKHLLSKHLYPTQLHGNELNFHAVSCLEGVLVNKSNSNHVTRELIHTIKNIVLNVISLLPQSTNDRHYQHKILSSCIRILCIIITDKLIPNSPDLVGEILGVVQAFIFYGIKDYPHIKPQILRPAAMNLPERMHIVPKCKNLKNHKTKAKRQTTKKTIESKNSTIPESKVLYKYSSDSDASDTEINNSAHLESKVRLEAISLLQALIENTQSREIFGYWPQIVATGSRNDARVLTRSILKEPVSKVRQNVLSTLTTLLIDARPFLIHAEDVNNMSFITFFGTVSLMIKELHITLSLILNREKNVAVLTHALKCVAALVQGTPYSRLKPGLATELIRYCRPYIYHKDPTIRVATLSLFEALASCEPLTPELLNVLAKQSIISSESDKQNVSSISDIGTEEEEIDIEDLKSVSNESFDNSKTLKEENISVLVHVCLKNISNKAMNVPVRFQSIKLIGRLAFNAGSLIFPHLEVITKTLIAVAEESELQVILHACRALEIIAGCLTNVDSNNTDTSSFWNIIFDPMISLAQHTQIILREAACDCLGSISPSTFIQLPRQKAILIITILFGAIRDEESAVRAAGLRALGMLVTLSPLEEDTGFLMDLADIVCIAADDQNLGVRVKGAWALANLCDCLSKRKSHEEAEPIPLEILLPKLYHISVKATKDSDKVKCNAVRAVGSILYMCTEKNLLNDTSSGLDVLITCASLGNDMKVRWNACRALGLVLSHNPDSIFPHSWKDLVFPALCTLICDSPNFKVRTNAAWALSSTNSYGKYIVTLWKCIVIAFENSQHVPSYVEYPHRDALVQQLCLTLSHVAVYTKESELQNLWAEIGDHVEDISNYMKQFQETILPEKLGSLIKAKTHFEKYTKTAPSLQERQIAQTLANIFERTNRYDNLDIIT